ncbi:MAG: hypothetical protein R3C44_16405 [Chloroflexota bacterium]
MGRTLGWILIAGGIIVGIVIFVLMRVYVGEGSLTSGAATLGMVLGFLVLVLPQLAVGTFILMRGKEDAKTADEAAKQRELLGAVEARGQVRISDMAIEMQVSQDEIKSMVYNLVSLGIFSGYINWDEGVLYSQQASQLRELSRCLNCNGQLELAGKGVIRCPYCGTEYFLS